MSDTNNAQANAQDLARAMEEKKVILYGAGKICRLFVKYLERRDLTPYAIWDQAPELVHDIPGHIISKPDAASIANKDDYLIIVTIFSTPIAMELAEDFAKQGFKHIYYEREIFGDVFHIDCESDVNEGTFELNHKTCHMCPKSTSLKNRCQIYDRHLLKEKGLFASNEKTDGMIVMDKLGFLIHNRCNLTCKGCNHLRDYYDDADNKMLPLDQIMDDLRKVSQAVDFIDKLVFVGGEAFLQKEFDKVLLQSGQVQNVGIMQIITNGTVVPKNTHVFDVMMDLNVIVEISGYGDNLTDKQKANVEKFIQHLEDRNIEYQHLQTMSWFNFGDFNHRRYNREKWKKVYEECCFISNDLFDGQLHKCSRSAFARQLNFIPDYKKDYVDVRSIDDVAELRAAIRTFIDNDMPVVCQHCNGVTADTIPAGVQTTAQKPTLA